MEQRIGHHAGRRIFQRDERRNGVERDEVGGPEHGAEDGAKAEIDRLIAIRAAQGCGDGAGKRLPGGGIPRRGRNHRRHLRRGRAAQGGGDEVGVDGAGPHVDLRFIG